MKIDAGAVATPQKDDNVRFHLRNTDKSTTYGVVLKINGESTIEHQALPALDCYKWILKPGKEIDVDAFQKGDTKGEQFTVLPPAASRENEVNFGDNAGVFSLVVFREANGDDAAFAQSDEKRSQEIRPISKGSLASKKADKPPRSLAALRDELTDEASPAKSSHGGEKGLIVGGPLGQSQIVHADFVPFPRPELSVVVHYYQPGH
jgi:hypothetical protein